MTTQYGIPSLQAYQAIAFSEKAASTGIASKVHLSGAEEKAVDMVS